MWVRGPAYIDGDEIVFAGDAAETYAAFEPDHATRLLFDLGNLGKLGEIVEGAKTFDVQLTDTERALDFAKTHGLLWHGPSEIGSREVRESLKDWFIAGGELSISTATYSNIRRSIDEGSAEPLSRYLRTLRDGTIFRHMRLPDDDTELLEFACVQLAERISRGMADCTPIFFAACALLRDGAKVGEAGDFRFGNDPGSLVGAANHQLALLISHKRRVRECMECGEMFIVEDPRQREHKKCGNRKRQRELRQRRKAE
jgi:hypothetical protein